MALGHARAVAIACGDWTKEYLKFFVEFHKLKHIFEQNKNFKVKLKDFIIYKYKQYLKSTETENETEFIRIIK